MTALAVALGIALAAALVGLVLAKRSQRAYGKALARATEDLERLQTTFSRFAPAEVVEQIAARGVAPVATEREVTVLFADLKGFTPLAGTLGPAKVVDVLNGFFREMTAAIAGHNGHVAKFLGDGLMALFGALERNPWQARDAVLAALAMHDALVRYNASLAARGLPALRFGVGIHRGPAIAGVIGSSEWLEYTVIGDTVNVASRIQDLTRVHDVEILVSEEVRAALDGAFRLRELPPVPVRGKQEPIRTYAVVGRDG